MKKVCSIIGNVKKIVVFERHNIVQSMVEFESLATASKARQSLHGCDIYNDCCTMKAEFSKLERLNVKSNGPMSWDFTAKEDNGSGPMLGKRRSILNTPDSQGGGGGGGSGLMGMMMGGGRAGGGGDGGMKRGGGGMLGLGAGGGGGGPPRFAPDLMRAAGGMFEQMMSMGAGAGMAGGPGGSCVLLVYGLESDKWTCGRLFNLLCQYGNVNQIFFMQKKQTSAMVEMGNHEAVCNVKRNLNDLKVGASSCSA